MDGCRHRQGAWHGPRRGAPVQAEHGAAGAIRQASVFEGMGVMTGMAETKEFLSTSEYAAKLGVTPMRVRRLCQDGRIPGAKKIGRDWRSEERRVGKECRAEWTQYDGTQR